VLSRSRAVFAAVSFSKVTVADFCASASLETGVMERLVIFPQKEKKSYGVLVIDFGVIEIELLTLTSFSVVSWEIP